MNLQLPFCLLLLKGLILRKLYLQLSFLGFKREIGKRILHTTMTSIY